MDILPQNGKENALPVANGNTYVEEVVSAKSSSAQKPKLGASGKQFEIRSISEIEANPETRYPTPDKEFDRVSRWWIGSRKLDVDWWGARNW